MELNKLNLLFNKFKQKYNINSDTDPEILRVSLFAEEIGELADLINLKFSLTKRNKDIPIDLNDKILDELCDILFLVIGTCNLYNYDLEKGLLKLHKKINDRIKNNINPTLHEHKEE